MKAHRKVLILSISVGSGHTRAAEAMKDAILEKDPLTEVEILDTFCYANPLLGKVIIGTYMELIKVSPLIYHFLYTKAEGKHNSSSKREFIRLLNKLTSAKLISYIEKFKPDVIVCTHPFPLGIVNTIKQDLELKTPVIAVITDYTVHPFWVFENVNYYIIANEELKKGLLRFGVSEEKVKVTGIPIDPQFANSVDKLSLIEKLGLSNKSPILLVMGGGLGLGPLKKIVNSLNNLNEDFQILVVVGKNKNLQKNLTELLPFFKKPTKVYGFVKNIHEFMEVSDLIVSKPGGLTSSESLAKGVPMVIINPIPGQEERNSEFLINAEVAVKVNEEAELPAVISKLLANPKQIETMKNSARQQGRSDSALRVAEFLLDLAAEREVKGGVSIETGSHS